MSPIKRLREVYQLTQQELAIKAGVRQQYVSDLETGRIKNPALLMAIKLADALDVAPTELLSDNPQQEKQIAH